MSLSGEIYRVAVTGHRPNRLPRSEWTRLSLQVDDVMAGIEAAFPGRRFVLLSGLAEGADRLAAHTALERGWQLAAMLPFSRARYMHDFPEAAAQQEFTALLDRAVSVEEAPAADAYTDGAQPYAEFGERLVAIADSLIVVWDGKPAAGRGGTVEVMTNARLKSIPVVRLHVLQDLPPEHLPPLAQD